MPRSTASLVVEAGGREVVVSSPGKVLFPAAGLTKADLARYLAAVAPAMLPHVAGRPVTLQRFPNGVDRPGFYSKERPSSFPDWVGSVVVPVQEERRPEGRLEMVVVDEPAALVYLAGQNCVTPHVWTSRVGSLENPDRLVFDLDPGERTTVDEVVATALELRSVLDQLGLVPFVKASGSRGVHVEVPLDGSAPFGEVRAVAEAVAELVADRDATARTTAFLKAERAGRLYLDVARNAFGAMTVAAYGVRALPEAPVAAPLGWEELEAHGFSPRRWTMADVPARLAADGDPWAGLVAAARPIGPAREALGAPATPRPDYPGRRRSQRATPP